MYFTDVGISYMLRVLQICAYLLHIRCKCNTVAYISCIFVLNVTNAKYLYAYEICTWFAFVMFVRYAYLLHTCVYMGCIYVTNVSNMSMSVLNVTNVTCLCVYELCIG